MAWQNVLRIQAGQKAEHPDGFALPLPRLGIGQIANQGVGVAQGEDQAAGRVGRYTGLNAQVDSIADVHRPVHQLPPAKGFAGSCAAKNVTVKAAQITGVIPVKMGQNGCDRLVEC